MRRESHRASPELGCLLLLARGDLTVEEQSEARGFLAQPLAWHDIARLVDEHGVVPTVVRNLRRLGWPHVPEAIRRELEAGERLNAIRNRLLARDLGTILGRFAQIGIPVIPLKGVALAGSLYGDVSLRVCSDVDVLVPRYAVGPAIELLHANGFRGADRYHARAAEIDRLVRSNMEYCLVSPPASFQYVLELHWDIAWRWRADAEMVNHLWADARPRTVLGADAWALSPEWELLYLAFHAARHRWSALKWLVDIHAICVRGGLDWTGVHDRAQRFGLERALHLTLGACRALLGTPLPSALEGHAPPRRLRALRAAPVTIGGWRETLSAVRLFSRPADQLRYLGRLLLRPTLAEWSLVQLPAQLRFLYYGLRPLRLGLASGRAMVRAGLGRLHR
jgi:putative nucleotidyltransferase-like protein